MNEQEPRCWDCEDTGVVKSNYTNDKGQYVFHKEPCQTCKILNEYPKRKKSVGCGNKSERLMPEQTCGKNGWNCNKCIKSIKNDINSEECVQ